MSKFDDEITFVLEKRNNVIDPDNVYSAEVIKDLAKNRGDSLTESGNLLIVKPNSQPEPYGKFAKRRMCITDPNQPEWGQYENYMKPSGVEIFFIFTKPDGEINRKRMKPKDLIVAVIYHKRLVEVVGTDDAEEIGHRLLQRAKMETGLSDDEIWYDHKDLTEYAQSMIDNGNMMWEVYDNTNKLINIDDFDDYLKSQGSSLNIF